MTARDINAATLALLLLSPVACGRSDFFGVDRSGLPGLVSGGATAGSSGRSSTGRGPGPNTSASNGSGTGSTAAGQGSGGSTNAAGTNGDGETSGVATSSGLTSGLTSGFTTSGTGGSSGISGSGSGSGTAAASGAGTGGSAAGSGATGGSGTGGGPTGGSGSTTGVGCNSDSKETPRKPCIQDSDCGCPDQCQEDPPFGKDCERSCVRQSDCSDTSYVCNGTYCQFNTCGGQTGNGAFNSTCNVTGTNDGTCVPFEVDGGTVGECVKGGTATTCCNQDATPAEADLLCAAGTICSALEGGECGEICDPFNPSCPPGQICAFEVNDFQTGGCFNVDVADGGSGSTCGE
jgi:hypothetical protein